MIRRSTVPIFSLSFLDCICCGFGAIILIFVLTMGSQTKFMQELRERLQRIIQQQLTTLAELRRSQEEILITQARASESTIALQERETLKQLLARLDQQVAEQKAARDKLLVDVDEIKADLAARQKPQEIELQNVEPAPIGLPAESNYVAFVIDSSGSMREPNSERIWPIVLKKFDEVLNSYPEVKGVQFLDADGRFILGRQAEQRWLPDNPNNRAAIKEALFNYDIFSNSNPVPGIVRALRTLLNPDDPEMRMTVFILGDEFTGTADAVLRRLEELNPKDEATGKRRVVINAIGFPTAVKMGFSMGNTGVKYANLMREACYQHGGAFIALREIEER